MDDIMHLRSGTDIRGTALSTDGKPIDLTKERLQAIASAFAHFLFQKLGKSENIKIAIGYDSRISSRNIRMVITNVFLAHGLEVYDCGMSSTPSMFMSIINHKMDAAIEITASHLPKDMNGLKFFTKDGGLSGEEIRSILQRASSKQFYLNNHGNKEKELPNMKTYCDGLRKMICEGVNAEDFEHPLKNLKIVVDPSNGVGEFYINDVLNPLGADTSGSIATNPDGMFPTHQPNPENIAAMRAISEAVINAGADLGIIFDTDCDRAACVSREGEEISRNKLVALASFIALKDLPTGIIVTDSVTSDGLTEFIEKNLGGIHHRFKRGYKNVIDEAKRLTKEGKNAPLAIETSGHAAFKENFYLDDGAYLATKIIILTAVLHNQGKRINDILKEMKEPKESKELRIKIKEKYFIPYGEKVLEDFKELAKTTDGVEVVSPNYEGVKIKFSSESVDGWMLLRLSLHEPLLVMNCESNVENGVSKMLSWVNEFTKQYESLEV